MRKQGGASRDRLRRAAVASQSAASFVVNGATPAREAALVIAAAEMNG
jgi:hypothetical protein